MYFKRILKNDIIDLTKNLQSDGTLEWKVPSGNWTIMRFGKRNNGAVTRPAPEPGLGFECDKFDTVAFNAHFDCQFRMRQSLKPLCRFKKIVMHWDERRENAG